MEQPAMNRFARWLQWAFTLYPVAALAVFYGFVVRARFALGYWPVYNHPDPKQLGFDLHHLLVWVLLLPAPIVAIFAVIHSITVLVVLGKRSWWRALWPVVVSFGLGYAILAMDPGEFSGWFID